MDRYQTVLTSSRNFLDDMNYSFSQCGWCNRLRNWAIDVATVLFNDSRNDLRALPKTVRLQLLLTLSFIWSTAFTIYIWGMMRVDIWLGWFGGHIAIIFASYVTFKQFHGASKRYIDYKFDGYHSGGRARGGMIGIDGTRVEFDPDDPGGEHE